MTVNSSTALTRRQWGAVAITFLFFYYAAFGFSWGMVPWIYQAEVNSLAMRTRGAAAATATNWVFGFVCTQFTSVGIRSLGYKFYISKLHTCALKLTDPDDCSVRDLQLGLPTSRLLPIP